MKNRLNDNLAFKFLYKGQAGVTLIEALISMLIFSVGALGLAAMQLNALSASGDSQQRSIILWKTQDLADRIRSNSNLADNYVARIDNATVDTIGIDTAAGVITCGSNQYAEPAAFCSDNVDGNSAVCTNAQKVNYDIWEVFCEPNTGLAVTGAVGGAGAAANGSVGIINLEVALIRNSVAAGDPDDDMLLYLEWVSKEADSIQSGADNVAGFADETIDTTLCGVDREVNAALDTYCLRFQP